MKSRTTPVHRMNLKGEILQTYNSISEAEAEFEIPQTNIVRCCQGKGNTAGGYRWKYVEEDMK